MYAGIDGLMHKKIARFSTHENRSLILLPSTHVSQKGTVWRRGRTTSLTIRLTEAERRTLQAWQRATTISAGRARRGRIILLIADGVSIAQVAATVGISRRFVYKWAERFLQEGLQGLVDKPGRGYRRVPRQATLTEQHDMDLGACNRVAC